MQDEDAGPYRNVRSLERGLRILEVLSESGWTKPADLASEAGIDRSSVYRLVNTLVELGYVVRRGEDGSVMLTARLSHISEGLRNDDLHAQIAAPFMRKLTRQVLWPSDFARFRLGEISIRFSTHKISPMSVHRAMIGKSRRILRSALGKAIVSAMSEAELEAARNIVGGMDGPDRDDLNNEALLRSTIARVHADGYASSMGESDTKISAIALPMRNAAGQGIGAMNLIFFSSALTPVQAAERYLPAMKSCVQAIETALAAEDET